MNTNKTKKFFTVIIFLLLLIIPLNWITGSIKSPAFSQIESRKLQNFPKIPNKKETQKQTSAIGLINRIDYLQFLSNIKNGTYQESIEKASSDQFLMRQEMISISHALDRSAIKIVYSFLPDPIIPSDMKSGLLISKTQDYLIEAPKHFDSKVKKNIDARAENYRFLVDAYPNINFFVFNIEKMEDSPLHPLNQYFYDADRGQAEAYFLTKIPEKLHYQKFPIISEQQYLSNFYRTDHHWNHLGITRAYEQIHSMLSETYPEIGPVLTSSRNLPIGPLNFLGSYARRSVYPVRPDSFIVPEFQLKPGKLYINGIEVNPNQSENIIQQKYSNYYGIFYRPNTAITEYHIEGNSSKNLLIIGASHAKPIVTLLAQHYKHTYFVDLREYKDFSFRKFIRKNPISDVIIIGNSLVIYRDVKNWYIQPSNKK